MSDAAEVRALIAEARMIINRDYTHPRYERGEAVQLHSIFDALEAAHAEPDDEAYTQNEYLAAIRAARYDIAQMHPGRGCAGCRWCTHVTMLEGVADALSGFRRSAHAEPDDDGAEALVEAVDAILDAQEPDCDCGNIYLRISVYAEIEAAIREGFRRSARVPVSRDELAAALSKSFCLTSASQASYLQRHFDIYPKADRKPADSGEAMREIGIHVAD